MYSHFIQLIIMILWLFCIDHCCSMLFVLLETYIIKRLENLYIHVMYDVNIHDVKQILMMHASPETFRSSNGHFCIFKHLNLRMQTDNKQKKSVYESSINTSQRCLYLILFWIAFIVAQTNHAQTVCKETRDHPLCEKLYPSTDWKSFHHDTKKVWLKTPQNVHSAGLSSSLSREPSIISIWYCFAKSEYIASIL